MANVLKAKISPNFVGQLTTLTLASLLVVGCSKNVVKPAKHEPTKLIKLDHQVQLLQPIFNVDVGGEIKNDPLNLQAVYTDNHVFIASRKGELMAFDPKTGKRLWLIKVGDAITSGVAYDSLTQSLIITTRNGQVLSFNAVDGHKLWEKQLSGTVLTPALISNNRVLLSANDGVLYGLSLQTGQSIWQFGTQLPAISIRGTAKPILLDAKTALFATADGRIHAIDVEAGIPRWSRSIGIAVGTSEVERMRDVDGYPIIDNQQLFAISYSGQLVAIDLVSGEIDFVKEDASLRSLAVTPQLLIATTLDGKILAFNRKDGSLIWESDDLQYRQLTNPITFGQYVAIGDLDGIVHVLDVNSGHIISRAHTKGALRSLQKQNDLLVTQSVSGHVAMWQIIQ